VAQLAAATGRALFPPIAKFVAASLQAASLQGAALQLAPLQSANLGRAPRNIAVADLGNVATQT
jgi:uncharacterized protein YjbI with pentapeptide repeats